MCGTYAYVSPETYYGNPYSTKSDIYAYAIVLWELINRIITGTYATPYSEYKQIKYDYQIIVMVSKKGLRPTIPQDTPLALKNIVSDCWTTEDTTQVE